MLLKYAHSTIKSDFKAIDYVVDSLFFKFSAHSMKQQSLNVGRYCAPFNEIIARREYASHRSTLKM